MAQTLQNCAGLGCSSRWSGPQRPHRAAAAPPGRAAQENGNWGTDKVPTSSDNYGQFQCAANQGGGFSDPRAPLLEAAAQPAAACWVSVRAEQRSHGAEACAPVQAQTTRRTRCVPGCCRRSVSPCCGLTTSRPPAALLPGQQHAVQPARPAHPDGEQPSQHVRRPRPSPALPPQPLPPGSLPCGWPAGTPLRWCCPRGARSSSRAGRCRPCS